MADGFLSRWSRRKQDVREGREPEPEPPPPEPAAAPAEPAAAAEPAVPEVPPPPTLEDAQALTPESDFRRFVQPDVAPDVRNAAVKKLFADPRFNVQDGLDVYIDDYGKPDPLPESMLRQLASARFLGFFREEERKDEPEGGTRDVAEAQTAPPVAQSAPGPAADEPGALPPAVPPDHADPDLRLQQDHAARRGGAGDGTG